MRVAQLSSLALVSSVPVHTRDSLRVSVFDCCLEKGLQKKKKDMGVFATDLGFSSALAGYVSLTRCNHQRIQPLFQSNSTLSFPGKSKASSFCSLLSIIDSFSFSSSQVHHQLATEPHNGDSHRQ